MAEQHIGSVACFGLQASLVIWPLGSADMPSSLPSSAERSYKSEGPEQLAEAVGDAAKHVASSESVALLHDPHDPCKNSRFLLWRPGLKKDVLS